MIVPESTDIIHRSLTGALANHAEREGVSGIRKPFCKPIRYRELPLTLVPYLVLFPAFAL